MLYDVFIYNKNDINLNSKELIKVIEKDGWLCVRTKGSHHHFKHPKKRGIVTIPHPKKDVPKGTLANIFRQAGIKS